VVSGEKFMEMNSRIENNVVILEFNGFCVGGENISSEAEELLAQGHERFIFIFNESCYMDSSTFGTIIAIGRQLLNRKGEFVFVVKSKSVSRLFTVTRVDKVFKLVDTIDDALAILTHKK